MGKKNREMSSRVNPQDVRAIVLDKRNLTATAEVVDAGLSLMQKYGAHTKGIDAQQVVEDFGNSIGNSQRAGPVWPLLTSLGRNYIRRWNELLQLSPIPEDSHNQFSTVASSLLGQSWLDFPDVTAGVWEKIKQLPRGLQRDWISHTISKSKLAQPIIAEGVQALGLLSVDYTNLLASIANRNKIDETSDRVLGTVDSFAEQRRKAYEELKRTPRLKPTFVSQSADLTPDSPSSLFASISKHLQSYRDAQQNLRNNTTRENTARGGYGYAAVASGLHSQTVIPASGELYDTDLDGYLHDRLKILLGIGAASGLLIPTITGIAKLEVAVDRRRMAAAYQAYTNAIDVQKQAFSDIKEQTDGGVVDLKARDVK